MAASTSGIRATLLALVVLAGMAGSALGHGGVEHQVNGTAEFATIVATLEAASNYTTLLSLLNNVTYQEALNITNGRDRTIFAPTDAAFKALPANVTAKLGNTTFVTEVLKFHLLPKYKNVTLLRTIAALSLPSMQSNHGQNHTFTLSGAYVLIDNVTIVSPDLLQDTNTAIHGIPKVLIPTQPPSALLVETYSTNSSHSGMNDTSSSCRLPQQSSATLLALAVGVLTISSAFLSL